jgi:putative flippase GtrA
VRFTRYTLGSVVATVASETAFAAVYGLTGLGTTTASVVAFVAGAIPNFILNRAWVWQRRGRSGLRREAPLYVATAAISLVVSAALTGWVSGEVPEFSSSHALRVAVVTGAYLIAYVPVFVAKFALFELVVFRDRPRHQATAKARVKRKP